MVLEAVVAKKLVVVALVPVALTKVKFWKVDEAVDKKPLVPVTNPVKFERPVTVKAVPTLKAPVVVALVEVEFRAVKLSKVLEPERRRFDNEVKPAVAVKVPVKLAAVEMV